MDKMFDTPIARELADLLYSRLKDSPNGELSFNEIVDMFEIKPEYGLRRVNGGAIHIIRERRDVEQLRDEKGKYFLKLI